MAADKKDNFDDDIELMTLTFDDNTSVDCEIIAVFEVDEKNYIALAPTKVIDGYDEGDLLLYGYKDIDEENFELRDINDEDEFEKVADAFDELLDEAEFNEMQ